MTITMLGSASPKARVDISFFLQSAVELLNMQRGFIPQAALLKLLENERIGNLFSKGWSDYLVPLASSNKWRLAGDVPPEDFSQCMMMGYLQDKDDFQAQGGIWHGIKRYDPTRGQTRATICPDCGSSFWSHEQGNSQAIFADTGIAEFRSNKNECPTQVKIKNLRVCGHVISGPYETEDAALISANGKHITLIDKKWHVVCGHPIDLMSYYSYAHRFIMKPLRAEHRRYLYASTKGRIPNVLAFSCSQCGMMSDYDEDLVDSEDEKSTYPCRHCGALLDTETLNIFVRERATSSLDAPISDGEQMCLGDLLPSNRIVSEELAQAEISLKSVCDDFMAILKNITDKTAAELRLRYLERLNTKIPTLKRALNRAKALNDGVKFRDIETKLQKEDENLIEDQNKIDYTNNLVQMYKLHYIGDHTGRIYDLRELTEKFMFKSLPYTECQSCKARMYEQNETGKIEEDALAARKDLYAKAVLGEVAGYSRDEILTAAPTGTNLFPKLGKYFHCTKCQSSDLIYFGPGTRNPSEPRVKMTPHIFQPAQREIKELESQIFSYKLLCTCGATNLIRPDKMSGKLRTQKISKTIVTNADGTRSAVREVTEYTCARCNRGLTLENVIHNCQEKDALSLLTSLKEFVIERDRLKFGAGT